MKVYTTFILSASITRGVTYAKLTHTVAEGRYTTQAGTVTAPYLFPAQSRSARGARGRRTDEAPTPGDDEPSAGA